MVAPSCTHNRGSEPVALSGARPRFYCRHSRRTIKLLFHISRLSSHSYRPGVPRLSLMERHVNPRTRRIPPKAATLTFSDVTTRYRSSDDAAKSGIRSFDLSLVSPASFLRSPHNHLADSSYFNAHGDSFLDQRLLI